MGQIKSFLLFYVAKNNVWHKAEGQYLFNVPSALCVFRSHSSAKCAGDRKGPPRDGEDRTVTKKCREFVTFQGGRHHHHFQRDGSTLGGLVRVGEDFLQETQENILQQDQTFT